MLVNCSDRKKPYANDCSTMNYTGVAASILANSMMSTASSAVLGTLDPGLREYICQRRSAAAQDPRLTAAGRGKRGNWPYADCGLRRCRAGRARSDVGIRAGFSALSRRAPPEVQAAGLSQGALTSRSNSSSE
jgi:hypothetical protein